LFLRKKCEPLARHGRLLPLIAELARHLLVEIHRLILPELLVATSEMQQRLRPHVSWSGAVRRDYARTVAWLFGISWDFTMLWYCFKKVPVPI
jgi:hypothetical protein